MEDTTGFEAPARDAREPTSLLRMVPAIAIPAIATRTSMTVKRGEPARYPSMPVSVVVVEVLLCVVNTLVEFACKKVSARGCKDF